MTEIRKGLFSVIPKETIELFNSDELELVLNGQPFIDIEEWKEYTEYRSPYSASHKVIKWFWECLQSLNQKNYQISFSLVRVLQKFQLVGLALWSLIEERWQDLL